MKRILILIFLSVSVLPGMASEEVWSGTKVISEPVKIVGARVRVLPGAKIIFAGEGRIHMRDGSFTASRAEFLSESVLTNDFRMRFTECGFEARHCRFTGLRTEKPDKRSFIYGFAFAISNGKMTLDHNTFVDCSAFMSAAVSHGMFTRNLFVRCAGGLALLNATQCRVEGNEFFDSPHEAMKLNTTRLSEIFRNRFTRCHIGTAFYAAKENRITGNAFFVSPIAFNLMHSGPDNVFSGNRYENVRQKYFNQGKSDGNRFFDDTPQPPTLK